MRRPLVVVGALVGVAVVGLFALGLVAQTTGLDEGLERSNAERARSATRAAPKPVPETASPTIAAPRPKPTRPQARPAPRPRPTTTRARPAPRPQRSSRPGEDPAEARVGRAVRRYFREVGVLERYGVRQVDADGPLITVDLSRPRFALGACTTVIDAQGAPGVPSFDRIVVAAGPGAAPPIAAVKPPGSDQCTVLP